MTQQRAFEILTVNHTKVACDGDAEGPLGHPRVYLHIDRAIGQVTCPYCSRCYVLEEGAVQHHG